MSYNKFENPLRIDLKVSHKLYIYKITTFLFALLSISITTSIPFLLRLLFVLILILIFLFYGRKKLFSKIKTISLSVTGEWTLYTDDGSSYEVELYGENIVVHFLLWLNFSTMTGQKFHLLLFSDSMDKEDLRLLRTRLRFNNYETLT